MGRRGVINNNTFYNNFLLIINKKCKVMTKTALITSKSAKKDNGGITPNLPLFDLATD